MVIPVVSEFVLHVVVYVRRSSKGEEIASRAPPEKKGEKTDLGSKQAPV